MTKGKKAKPIDTTTEEKIKEAARVVFLKKGYAATRTRDIAEEAGINLALLNYYFRSKEKLFNIIMLETVNGFIQTMTTILNDEKSTLEKKVELIASNYIDFVLREPNIPIFMLSEMRNNADGLLERMPVIQPILKSTFFIQHQDYVAKGKITEPNPFQFFLNLLALTIFPFISSPLVKLIGGVNDTQFTKMMQERKKLIPVWIKAMMKAK
ncbi:MAG: TetR/AcrR family transcriptional regulator [Bacteroidetes bacterium]|nr:TetR/AcrR family transcriptional regulator [Bacteroidota bacterium]